ncbi:MAG: M28 family peptidase, partial [Pseudonocardiaceae bacterium]
PPNSRAAPTMYRSSRLASRRPVPGPVTVRKRPPSRPRAGAGRAGEVFDPCYHTACDRLDNVDSTALDRYTDAVAGTMAHFATSIDGLSI